MEFEVLVKLKEEVLDPEARAILETLRSQGVSTIEKIEVSKRYVVTANQNSDSADEAVNFIAENYLANPVSQTFEIKRIAP
jgi:phosphoribosylformylglycinamidine synthase PurS subunit